MYPRRRIRPRRLRRRRGREERDHRRPTIAAGDVVLGPRLERPALQRLLADPQDRRARGATGLAAEFDGRTLGERAARADAHLREARARAPARDAGQGPGAHHRRRPRRERAAHAARTSVRAHSSARSWTRAAALRLAAASRATSPTPRCSACSTAASAWWSSSPQRDADARERPAQRRRRDRLADRRGRRPRAPARHRPSSRDGDTCPPPLKQLRIVILISGRGSNMLGARSRPRPASTSRR